MVLPFQIYRHFKGGLYLTISTAISESTLEHTVVYMSLNGDNKVWIRSLSDFESLVPEDKNNPTGQKYRFELVKDIQSILSQCTTENLIAELKNRPDSSLNEADFEGLNDKVVLREYVVGEIKSSVSGEPELFATVAKNTLEEAKRFVENFPHRCSSRTKIYKSILVEVESFD